MEMRIDHIKNKTIIQVYCCNRNTKPMIASRDMDGAGIMAKFSSGTSNKCSFVDF